MAVNANRRRMMKGCLCVEDFWLQIQRIRGDLRILVQFVAGVDAGLMIGNPWKSYIGDVPSIFNEIEGSPVLFLFQSLTPPGALDFATWQSDRT